jgi:hypothetical protein
MGAGHDWSSPALGPNQTAVITFKLTEPSANFTVADDVSTNGTLSDFKGSGTVYTATFTPVANATTTGTVSVPAGRFTDAAGNPSIAATSPPISIDTVIRAWSSSFGTAVDTAPTVAAQVRIMLIMFNAPVSNVTLSGLQLFYSDQHQLPEPPFRSLGLTGATVTPVNPVGGSSATWVLTFPATTTAQKGIYRLGVGGPQSGIRAGEQPMPQVSSLFWKWLG